MDSGAYVYGANLAPGGHQNVYGFAYETLISSGGVQTVDAGGTADLDQISSGGNEYVASGGVDSASTVSKGGRETVSSGGAAYADYCLVGRRAECGWFRRWNDRREGGCADHFFRRL